MVITLPRRVDPGGPSWVSPSTLPSCAMRILLLLEPASSSSSTWRRLRFPFLVRSGRKGPRELLLQIRSFALKIAASCMSIPPLLTRWDSSSHHATGGAGVFRGVAPPFDASFSCRFRFCVLFSCARTAFSYSRSASSISSLNFSSSMRSSSAYFCCSPLYSARMEPSISGPHCTSRPNCPADTFARCRRTRVRVLSTSRR
mmetsp:Transcript_10288/g.29376  ORF Transcript_10288/g.29376 Transcript_10288/m.29376 type:complete len:201 (+) Transcript_10288:240-842(+)